MECLMSVTDSSGIQGFVCVLIIIAVIFYSNMKKSKMLMPGPTGLPLIGYVPFLTKRPYVKFKELAKIYGPVYRIRLGNQDVVVLCDFKSIKEAFGQDAFLGYPPNPTFKLNDETIKTGAITDLPWKEQKRFSLRMLSDLGFGKTRMEELIKEEVLHFLQHVDNHLSSAIVINNLISSSMSNVLCHFLFGRGFDPENTTKINVVEVLREANGLIASLSWHAFFPCLRTFSKITRMGKYWRVCKAIGKANLYCRKEINEHDSTLNPDEIRDFVDGYLLEIEKHKTDPASPFKKKVLEDVSRAILGAGVSNSSNVILWLLLVNAAFPEVQEKIRKEIDEVIGPDRFPCWEDKDRMPYTEACILELMRWKILIPLNVMRYTLEDTYLNDYFIPKHTHVLANFWAVLHDQSLWGTDTHLYRPERFLSEDGKTVLKPEYYIPFSIGKRACPGRNVVEIMEFTYVVAVLQKFKLSLPPGITPDLEDSFDFRILPKLRSICFERC